MMFSSLSDKILFLIICFILFPSPSSAQVTLDYTLGLESSKINIIDRLCNRIEGGVVRGENLFHSFREFGDEEGSSVDFAKLDGIAYIFSHITGDNISKIFGELGVDDAANLLLDLALLIK